MNLRKEFKLFILPAIKGLPLWLSMMVMGYFLANYTLRYITPEYEVGAKIKLDNREHGTKDIDLFEENKSSKTGSNFLTEVEVFKTKALQRKAIEQLDFDVSVFRILGERKSEIYKENPFFIDYKILDSIAYDKDIFVKYVGNGKFRFYKDIQQKEYSHSLKFKKAYTDSTSISYRIRRNNKFLKNNPQALQVGDFFAFRVNNLETLVKGIDDSNFFCMPVDKNVFIVKLHYKHEHPQKAADFVNSLLNTYIKNNNSRKNSKTSKMLSFIEGQLDSLGDAMNESSLRLSTFRKQNNIINPLQETESILRKLNEFDMSKLSLDLKEIELSNINDFLKSDRSTSGFSPDFELVRDDVFENTFIELKKLEIEKFEMSKRFPETSLEIQTINAQIRDLKAFAVQSIEKKIINIGDQKSEISSSIRKTQSQFESYPDKERQLAKLERDFLLKEETFNTLNKKKLELDIAHSADHSLHEVVDYATPPKRAAYPNAPLIKGVAVFAFLILGLILVYVLNFFFRTVSSVYELKENLNFPVLATVGKQKKALANRESLLNLYSNFLSMGAFEGNKMITLSSLEDNEGKTFIAKELGNLLADYGKRVLLIDMNFGTSFKTSGSVEHEAAASKASTLDEYLLGIERAVGSFLKRFYWTRALLRLLGGRGKNLQELMQQSQNKNLDYVFLTGEDQHATSTQLFSPNTKGFLQEMKNNYDVVLIDTDNISKKIDAAAAMMISDLNCFVFRKGVTKVRNLNQCKQFVESYNLDNVYLVLNDVR